MSDRIKLEIEGAEPTVQPGASASITLVVHNTSTIVDQYSIQVDGMDSAWFSVSPTSVSLFPGDQSPVNIDFRPPASTDTVAGSHPFTITATSQDNPAETSQLTATLTVRPFGDFSISVAPEKVVGRRANYKLTLANTSNADIPLSFSARDEEEALDYTFEWDKMTVPAGGSVDVGLDVNSKRSRLTGEAQQHRITVAATREGHEEEPVDALVEFEYHARFGNLRGLPVAKWRWLLLLVPVLAILLALRYCTEGPKADLPVTPTVAAAASGQPTPTVPTGAPTVLATATPVPLPSIANFSIERDGANYLLVWEVTGAKEVQLDGASVKPADKKAIGPLANHEFELKASNAGGTVSRRIALVVMPPPTIKSFASSAETLKLGDTATLTWEVADAKKATIDGASVDIPKGKVAIKPEQSRDYVIIAENDVGWVVQRVHVNVIVPTPGP